MGTRSRIGYIGTNGRNIVSVYCHWDGYPSHNGKILLENYNTLDKVKELVDEGDISSLRPKCNKPEGHSFNKPVDGYTIYYGRDRGEIGVRPLSASGKQAFLKMASDSGGEYAYLFVPSEDGNRGEWFYSSDMVNLKPLTKKDCEED